MAWLEVTIMMWRVPPFFCVISLLGKMPSPNINAGNRMVVTRKALVRTLSRYSRRAISQILRIALSYRFNEDFFERRLHQLEAIDAHARHGFAEQVLAIDTGLEPRFHVISVIVEGFDQRAG